MVRIGWFVIARLRSGHILPSNFPSPWKRDTLMIMSVRRLAAFGLAAVMVHLSVARADVACAAHGAHQGNPAAQQDHSDAGDHAPHDTRCDTPSQQDCCEALASCSVILGPGGDTHVAQRADAIDRVISAAVLAPLSRVAAPDPPPPRV